MFAKLGGKDLTGSTKGNDIIRLFVRSCAKKKRVKYNVKWCLQTASRIRLLSTLSPDMWQGSVAVRLIAAMPVGCMFASDRGRIQISLLRKSLKTNMDRE